MSFEIAADEIKSSAGTLSAANNVLRLPVNQFLPNRKLYFFAWTAASDATDNCVRASLRLYDASGAEVGRIPVGLGISKSAGSKISKSIPCFCNVGGSPIQDTMSLVLSAPTGNQPAAAILVQPFYVRAQCAQVAVCLEEIINLTDFRCYLAVASTT